MLITTDVGHTLSSFDRPGTADALRDIALAPDNATESNRNILHVSASPKPRTRYGVLVREFETSRVDDGLKMRRPCSSLFL